MSILFQNNNLEVEFMQERITLIGTLPPIKGISDTCIKQVNSISKYISIDFIDFKSLYPEFFYPGGTEDKTFSVKFDKNVTIEKIISWYNPFSWIKAGLKPKTNIVHFHWWTFYLFPIFFLLILILKIRGKKVICEVHNILGHETNFLDEFLIKIMFKLPDYFIVHTIDSKQKLKKLFGIEKNISIVPLGLPDFYSDKKVSKHRARNFLGVSIRDKVLLTFGNIRKYKGMEDLIEAFYNVKKTVPNTKLVIAGKPWVDWSLYHKLIKKYKIEKDILLFLDFIPTSHVKYYFTACDLVILPYKQFDAQSGPGRLALLFNKPLVVTNVGGLPDLVKYNGAIAEPDDVKDLSNKIIQIIKDEKLMKKLSVDSMELSKKYNWDNIGEETIQIYNSLVRQV